MVDLQIFLKEESGLGSNRFFLFLFGLFSSSGGGSKSPNSERSVDDAFPQDDRDLEDPEIGTAVTFIRTYLD